MLGSTIVFIPELPEDLSNLYERIVENGEFETLDLDCLTSLDFAIITGKDNTKWNSVKDPVVYDEEAGLVICQISKAGLISVIEYKGDLENIDKETQDEDLLKLKEFADKFGYRHLYELVTF
jgi:hypothetical protein